MTTRATPTRDPFMPRTPKGFGPGLALAMLAHALLIAGLAYSVDWRTRDAASVEAELWAAVPQLAAPRATAPEPQTHTPTPKPPTPARPPDPVPSPPPPPIKAEPTPRPKPAVPTPAPLPDPQIAIEKAKAAKRLLAQRELAEQEQVKRTKELREKALKIELERQDADREKLRVKDDQARKKLLAEKSEKAVKVEKDKAEKDKAEKDKAAKEKAETDAKAEKAQKADAIQQAANRDANLKRMQGLANATGTSAATGTALKSSGPSASYAGRIMARIKPNLVFADSAEGNPTATVEVKLAPDGTIIGKRLLQSSGVKAWDEAVLRALDRTEMLPRDIDGRVPPPFPIVFRLRD